MSIPEGWYPDPENATQLRWWDGIQWTAHVHTPVEDVAQYTIDSQFPSATNESYEAAAPTQADGMLFEGTQIPKESLQTHPLTRVFTVLACLFTIATICVVGFTFGDTRRSITKMTNEIEDFQRDTKTYEHLQNKLQTIADELGVGQGN